MPIYEYRCASCGAVFSRLSRRVDEVSSVECASCGAGAVRIISGVSIHRSLQSQIDGLDPRFEKQLDAVDNAKKPRIAGSGID
jgi:putative FmdB family regulatory protein